MTIRKYLREEKISSRNPSGRGVEEPLDSVIEPTEETDPALDGDYMSHVEEKFKEGVTRMRSRKLVLTEAQLRNIIRDAITETTKPLDNTRSLTGFLFEDDDGGDEGDDDGGDESGEDEDGRMGAAETGAEYFDDAGSDMESRRADMQARTDKAARDNDTRHQSDARGTRLSKAQGGGGPKSRDMR